VAIQGAALINAVLNHQGQEQHSIDVPNVQLLDADRYLLTLCSLASTPGVQVRTYCWRYHLYRQARCYDGSSADNLHLGDHEIIFTWL